MQEYL